MANMWVMAKQNHVNIRTGQKVLTQGKQYQVIGYRKKDGYTVKNDNNKTGFYPKELFQIME
jgi:DNA-binding transcriptional regulator YhcF (GntR family)